LVKYAQNARRDGYCGMLAIHPDQVAVINDAFVPSESEIARAEKIVKMFGENAGSGVMQLDGEMIDRPHFIQASQILDLARRSK
jgi:citrate lyase subunit beta/citryl-CoA lyase